MALSVTVRERHSLGSLKANIVEVSFDDSYPTGGEALTAGDLGLTRVSFALAEPASGYAFEYDHTNSKLLAYYADYDAGADGPLIQVPDTTDLNPAVAGVRLIAFGK